MSSVANELADRGISEIVHFTTNKGLVAILATGFLRSRRQLPRDKYLQYILHPNSAVRPEAAAQFDKSKDWLDYVNLSVSEINSRFFGFSRDWEHNKDLWWAVLSFDAAIATHPGVHFATTNCKYEHCTRMTGPLGFKKLFGDRIRRIGSWGAVRGGRGKHLTTCEQAEVLYPKEIATTFLRKIYVREAAHSDTVRGWLREFEVNGVAVVVDPEKFSGVPN